MTRDTKVINLNVFDGTRCAALFVAVILTARGYWFELRKLGAFEQRHRHRESLVGPPFCAT